MGVTELLALQTYLKREEAKLRMATPPEYPPYTTETLNVNSGVFPKGADSYDHFCSTYLDAVKNCDGLAAWDVAGELTILSRYCANKTLFLTKDLEPYFNQKPWSASLAGKRVLVVSPFTNTIALQYAKRTELWSDQSILPEFELLTVRAPLSAGLVSPKSNNWHAALDLLKAEVSSLNYDVMLVGAGAFSLPLITHAKNSGKVGIHMGGALQVLFGITGNRWEQNADFKLFIRDSWTRPSGEERPATISRNENACYW